MKSGRTVDVWLCSVFTLCARWAGGVVKDMLRPNYPAEYLVPAERGAGWALGPVSVGRENLLHYWLRTPARLAFSELLYRLHDLGRQCFHVLGTVQQATQKATKKYWFFSYIMVAVPMLNAALRQLRFTGPSALSVIQASFVWKGVAAESHRGKTDDEIAIGGAVVYKVGIHPGY